MAKTIFTKDPVKYIPSLAEALKKIEAFEIPEWAAYVKSGVSRERPPTDEDFWHIRAASILRQLYIKGVVGVGKLRTRYGSKKDRGGKPDKFKKSGGKIIRVILQQAEMAGLVEKVTRLQHGRRLTQAGRDLLDSIEVDEAKGLDMESVSIRKVEVVQENTQETEHREQETEDGSGKASETKDLTGEVADKVDKTKEEVKE